MRSPAGLAIAWTLALVSGFAATYGVLRLGAWVTFEGNADAGVFVSWLAPLGGLAAFALIYGLGRGRAMRLGFWVMGPVVAYAAAFAGTYAVGQGVTLRLAVAGPVLIATLAALALLVRDARHD